MNKSPHLVIARSFDRIKNNSIILENRRDVHDDLNKNRQVYYDLKEIGSNIVLSQKNSKYLNLKQEETKNNCIYILYRLSDNFTMEGIVLYSEMGTLINNKQQIRFSSSYILLAVIQNDKSVKNSPVLIDSREINLVKKVLYNQVKKTKSYHFETKGSIYGFGYSVKYRKGDNSLYSYGRYSQSEYTFT